MSDDIVKKVAAVIYAQCGSMDETYDDDLNALAPHDRVNWYRIAQAAIAAYEAATTDHIEIGKPSPIYGIPVQGTWSQSGFKPLPDINRIRELEEERGALMGRVRELEEALKPFANGAPEDCNLDDEVSGFDLAEFGLVFGDLRRAHAVLEGKK